MAVFLIAQTDLPIQDRCNRVAQFFALFHPVIAMHCKEDGDDDCCLTGSIKDIICVESSDKRTEFKRSFVRGNAGVERDSGCDA